MRFVSNSGELETMVPIILLATLRVAIENLCVDGYCFFLLALFSLFKEDALVGL